VISAGSCCKCGTPVERQRCDGCFSEILDRLQLLCDDCAAVEGERLSEEDRAAQARLDRERFERKLRRLPAAHRERRLDDLDGDGRARALDAARRWAAGELAGLELIGGIGVGKTTIAAAATVDYVARHLYGPTPRWIPATLALSNLSKSFENRERARTIDELTCDTAPLILDDLDKGKPTQHSAVTIFTAIDVCVTHKQPLIVTTNLTPSQLAANWPAPYGEAIASRLVGYCEQHEITGLDRRSLATPAVEPTPRAPGRRSS
jgi:DNA replication protein DnaC